MKYLIRVPATSANLGPGFDCLGLALDLWNEVEISTDTRGLVIELRGFGEGILPVDETNAIFTAMQKFAEVTGKQLPENIHLTCNNNIPLGSGLGSSAAASVAGLLCASVILNASLSQAKLIEIATQFEGHPDNVAPCVLGGATASLVQDGQVITRQLEIAHFDLVLVHPNFTFPTRVARSAIPKSIPQSDAVFNISHSILTTEALRTGDLDLLRIAMRDKVHQPYRLPLIPGAEEAIKAADKAGAVTTILSGAGPSLIAFSPSPQKNHEIANAIQSAFGSQGLLCEQFFPEISSSGAEIIPLD